MLFNDPALLTCLISAESRTGDNLQLLYVVKRVKRIAVTFHSG